MGTLLDLSLRMKNLRSQIAVASSNASKEIAINLIKDLVFRTPVDTSTALSNWQISLNSPNQFYIEAYEYGYLGYTQQASAQITISVAQNILKSKKPGQIIYVVNNAPYIKDLNSGTSKQAPAGFVEASIATVTNNMPTLKLG